MMPSSIPHSTITFHPASSSSSSLSSSASSPCAACKCLRRKCQPDCIFAPYFPPDNPQKFLNVHRVFGASNVTKILTELHAAHREDAVNSLAYEADMRIKDPVYGCVGVISLLQRQLRQLQEDLGRAKNELSRYLDLNGLVTGAGNPNPNYYPYYQQQQQQQHLMLSGYENEVAARMGLMNGNGGGYGGGEGIVAAANGSHEEMLGAQFLQMSSNGSGEQRPNVGPSA